MIEFHDIQFIFHFFKNLPVSVGIYVIEFNVPVNAFVCFFYLKTDKFDLKTNILTLKDHDVDRFWPFPTIFDKFYPKNQNFAVKT